MSATESVAARRCGRTFTILPASWREWPAEGGGDVRVTWDCGATRVFRNQIAIDVEFLADHLPTAHHHHLHRSQHLPHFHHRGAKR